MTFSDSPTPRRAHPIVLIVIGVLIVVWQFSFHRPEVAVRLDQTYWIRASSGLPSDMDVFFYFYWTLGQFPVGIRGGDYAAGPTRDDAQELVKQHGPDLVMAFNTPANSTRDGDWGRMFLYVPSVLMTGDPRIATVRPANEIVWIIALLALFYAMALNGHLILGVVLVALIGSDPMQLVEVYRRPNVFSYAISVALILLALHVRLLIPKPRIGKFVWLIPAISGIVLASAREIRGEPFLMILSLPIIYLSLRSLRWFHRFGLIATLVCTFLPTNWAFASYFDAKFRDAERFVREAGGQRYLGPHSHHHVVWHNLFTGLSDFDPAYRIAGEEFNDHVAYLYVTPVLRADYGLDFHFYRSYYFESYDMARYYLIKPEDLPEYSKILARKVLGEIRAKPSWYASILVRRFWVTLTQTTPIQLALADHALRFTFNGLMALIVLAVLLIFRQFFYAKLILFTAPLSLPGLLIYSGKGMTYYAIFHVIAFGVLACWIGGSVRKILAKGRARRSSDAQQFVAATPSSPTA